MLFRLTPLSAFRPEIQLILEQLDGAVRADMLKAGDEVDDKVPFSHYAQQERFDASLMLDEPFLSLFRYENVEFMGAYLRDVDQSAGWDPFLIFADDTGNGFATEISLERAKGGMSSVLSRISLQEPEARFAVLMSLLEWSNGCYQVLDPHEPGGAIKMLHVMITGCFLCIDKVHVPHPNFTAPVQELFQRVTGMGDLQFDAVTYREALMEIIGIQTPALVLNNLVPHLLYDPVVYMCEAGYSTEKVLERIKPAFDVLMEPLDPDPIQKQALFEQMLYNALSLYPERLKELPIGKDTRFQFGDHPLLREPGSLSALTRILAGPLGAFATDLLMDVPDEERLRQMKAEGVTQLLGLVDSHLVRTPAAACLKVIEDTEDLVMLDYLLARNRIASETIHYAWRSMSPAIVELSDQAQLAMIAGEMEFCMSRNRLDESALHRLSSVLKQLPQLLTPLCDHMMGLLDQGVDEHMVSRCAQQLGLLNAELLRKPGIAKRQAFHEALMGQDLGL